jgi:hypothetical protein
VAPPTDIFNPPQPEPEPEPEEPPPGAASLETSGDSAPALVAAASAASEPATVELSLVAGAASEVGDELPVRVMVHANAAVSHLPEALLFDPADLAVVRVEPGAFLGATSEAQVLADYSRPGEVLIGASRLGERDGVEGAGVIATVVFRVLRRGPVAIEWGVTQALDRGLQPVGKVVARPLKLRVGPPRTEPRQPRAGLGVEGP